MEKKIKCKKCGEITTISGKPGETINVACQSCYNIEKVTFENIKSSTSNKSIVQINYCFNLRRSNFNCIDGFICFVIQ